MTVEARLDTGSSVEIPKRISLVEDPLTPGIRSELVTLDRNNVRVEHYKPDGESEVMCGRGPVLHGEAISEAQFRVELASGSAESIKGTVVWKRDNVTSLLRERLSSIRREIASISQD